MTKLQGFHSLGYKNFQDFSRTPEAFLQDPVVRQRCLNTKTNSSYYGVEAEPRPPVIFSYIQIKSQLIFANVGICTYIMFTSHIIA